MAYDRFTFEEVAKKEAVKIAKKEMEKARVILETYQIRSTVAGTVHEILKHPGEAVRYLDPVIAIEIVPEPVRK